ncbi:MAG: class 1 fructose-bisphosphatase [Myxococcales bacterium]|nr:class 1 fructose-bisphosphatase [Myxococcales bacterium]MCB9648210.1 class 1 fructose-bisphosphatase [Deltaproteobacteria bacterium]
MTTPSRVTLTQHILRKQTEHPGATGQLSSLLTQIGVAGKLIQAQVRRAGLIEIWGATGDTNVQGETVQKLDRIAQDALVDVLKYSGAVAGMASEEEHDSIEVPPALAGDYIVVFDPLDGSSNIDANVSIGTIFGIFKRKDPHEVLRTDFLRPGREMIAAGYIIYSSSTVVVYTDGTSVDGFTLDPAAGEYFLSRPNIRMPDKTKVLSVNECNEPYWPKWVKPYVETIKGRNDHDKRRVSSRHIGSLVSDFHRNLLYGGVFLYPADSRTNKGKLRLLYECNPLAFIAQAAGGYASNGLGPILDLQPTALHDRATLIIGPKADVELAERMVKEYA